MEEKDKLVASVSEKINLNTIRQFLVKPLDPIMVKKEFSKPIPADKQKGKDKDGVDAVDYDKVETEVKEVESDYRKGVVLKVPFEYEAQMKSENFPTLPIHVGDTIIYNAHMGKWYDLLKDSVLISGYDIIGVENA